MTESDINVAIAEVCGIKKSRHNGQDVWEFYPMMWHLYPPQYTRDLNLMHQVESRLTEDQWVNYVECLGDKGIHATARKRAEALLKTLEKWEEKVK